MMYGVGALRPHVYLAGFLLQRMAEGSPLSLLLVCLLAPCAFLCVKNEPHLILNSNSSAARNRRTELTLSGTKEWSCLTPGLVLT